jgi:hypothetical protein
VLLAGVLVKVNAMYMKTNTVNDYARIVLRGLMANRYYVIAGSVEELAQVCAACERALHGDPQALADLEQRPPPAWRTSSRSASRGHDRALEARSPH